MNKEKLNIGIIGLGIGERHIRGYICHPSCQSVTLCDFDPIRLAAVGKQWPGMALTSNDIDILENPEIDIVSIASHDEFHARQVICALDHGKHVFVEKPICLTRQEAAEIRMALKRNSKQYLSSNLILRKTPRFTHLKDRISAGRFGDIYYLEGDYNYGRLEKLIGTWRSKTDKYSIVHAGGIHMIDLLCWLNASRITEVSAMATKAATKNTDFIPPDTVVAIFKFENGSLGKMTANFGCVSPHFHKLSVYGTKATFENHSSGAIYHESRDMKKIPETLADEYPGNDKDALIFGFIESILQHKQQEVSAEDVLAAMSVCLAIEDAIQLGCKLEVQYY